MCDYLACIPLPYRGFLYLGMRNGAEEVIMTKLHTHTIEETVRHIHVHVYTL